LGSPGSKNLDFGGGSSEIGVLGSKFGFFRVLGSKSPKFRVWVKNGKLRDSQAGFLLDGGGKIGGGRPGPGFWGFNGKQRKMTIFKVFGGFGSVLTVFQVFRVKMKQ